MKKSELKKMILEILSESEVSDKHDPTMNKTAISLLKKYGYSPKSHVVKTDSEDTPEITLVYGGKKVHKGFLSWVIGRSPDDEYKAYWAIEKNDATFKKVKNVKQIKGGGGLMSYSLSKALDKAGYDFDDSFILTPTSINNILKQKIEDKEERYDDPDW